MTPAVSYRVRFKESLGTTVKRILDGYGARAGVPPPALLASASEDSEYADVGPGIVETVSLASGEPSDRTARVLRRLRDWVRSRYGLREIILPEKYRVDGRNEVVVTYSSCLALVYFADDLAQLGLREIRTTPRRAALYAALLAHPGIGLVATRLDGAVHLESQAGRAVIEGGALRVLAGTDPLATYTTPEMVVRAVHDMVMQPNAGDLVLFGAYDGYDIISFDDQVGAHGAAGGDQVYPFLITPASLDLSAEPLENARDIHRTVLGPYAEGKVRVGGPTGGERGSAAAD